MSWGSAGLKHGDWGDALDLGFSNVQGKLAADVQHIYSTSAAFSALKVDGMVVAWGDTDEGGDCQFSTRVETKLASTGGSSSEDIEKLAAEEKTQGQAAARSADSQSPKMEDACKSSKIPASSKTQSAFDLNENARSSGVAKHILDEFIRHDPQGCGVIHEKHLKALLLKLTGASEAKVIDVLNDLKSMDVYATESTVDYCKFVTWMYGGVGAVPHVEAELASIGGSSSDDIEKLAGRKMSQLLQH